MLHLMLQMHAPFHGGIPFLSIDKDPSIFAARHHPLIVLEKRVHKGRGMDGWVEERERERVCVWRWKGLEYQPTLWSPPAVANRSPLGWMSKEKIWRPAWRSHIGFSTIMVTACGSSLPPPHAQALAWAGPRKASARWCFNQTLTFPL